MTGGERDDVADMPPQPDPSIRATEIVDKGLAALKEQMLVRLDAEHDLCQEKFAGIEQRFSDQDARTAEQKADTKAKVDAAFAAAKDAIALQTTASEKAIDKSEQATAKELSQMAATFGTAFAGLSDKVDAQTKLIGVLMPRTEWDVAHRAVEGLVNALDKRVTGIESVKVGGAEARNALYAFAGFLVALLAIGGFVAAMWPK